MYILTGTLWQLLLLLHYHYWLFGQMHELQPVAAVPSTHASNLLQGSFSLMHPGCNANHPTCSLMVT
jgi:hypothetical protein